MDAGVRIGQGLGDKEVAAAMDPAPNAAEIGNWNDVVGRTWAMLHERLDRQIAPIGRVAMAKAQLEPGDRVLDVGCGCGESTLEIAAHVAPGEVVGLDGSALLLDIAREAAARRSASNIAFVEGDAQTCPLPVRRFDVLYSRFGVMFFADPAAAFAHLRGALRPGARLAFCCWRSPAENPYLSLPMQAVGNLLPPLPPPDPNAPGPFAFADAGRVRTILDGAGFADVAIEPLDIITGTDSLEESVFQTLRMGPLGSALRQLGASDELKAKVEAGLRDALAAHVRDGVVRLAMAAWIVSARAP